MQHLSWEDLQILLAISESGSMRAASRRLGVNSSTVSRRLAGLERRVGTPLLDRRGHVLSVTNAGNELLGAAACMRRHANEALSAVQELSGPVEGKVIVATSPMMALGWVVAALGAVQAQNPALQFDLRVCDAHADANLGDADVAVLATNYPPNTLIGRWVGRMPMAEFGDPERPLLQPDDGALRTDSALALARAVQCGLGRAVLPISLGDVVDLGPGRPRAAGCPVWVFTHPGSHRIRRVRTASLSLVRWMEAAMAPPRG